MQRSSTARYVCKQILRNQTQIKTNLHQRPPCDVFINHRGIDTKRNVAGLLYNHLRWLGFRPFLDSKNMKPGDKLFDNINVAIHKCKVGVAVFSPQYCNSYFCLHELALMMECKKKVIPIFCDVKPSELRVKDDGICPTEDLDKFHLALEEAKHTVGLTFDTLRGDWPEFLDSASDAVIKNLLELEKEKYLLKNKNKKNYYIELLYAADYEKATYTVTKLR
ncbi:TMV resistance protein N-like [Olea europaea var. sylvestris]|uniref:TMV resistance protein N-like n=1 Tax=Olea europaea var. sylvestris TaxID=158386 RepID=UPI000C1D2E21|nr:TMV resistance protein N-like [Olea europaea var. sylvestris]